MLKRLSGSLCAGNYSTRSTAFPLEGLLAHEIVPIIDSYSDILLHTGLCHTSIEQASSSGGPPVFICAGSGPGVRSPVSSRDAVSVEPLSLNPDGAAQWLGVRDM
jgi:hypothetical protein